MPNIREIIQDVIIICQVLLTLKFFFRDEASATQRSQRALNDVILVQSEIPAEETVNYFRRLRWLECTLDAGWHFFASKVYGVANESIQPEFSSESEALTPGDGVSLKDDVTRSVETSNSSNTFTRVVDIPRLLNFKITTCASPSLARPSCLLRIPGSTAQDDENNFRFRNLVPLWNIIPIGRRGSPRQFHHIINLPQNWRGDIITHCEIQNTVVVISYPLQVVVHEDAVGGKIFCTRSPSTDVPD